jgi:hypothetical protein
VLSSTILSYVYSPSPRHTAFAHSRHSFVHVILLICRAAVATVGDMQEAVEAALGVSEEAAVAVEVVTDDKNGRKRYRMKSEEDEAADGKSAKRSVPSHEDQLASRRFKDRQRYASMTRRSCILYWQSDFIACGSIVSHAHSEPCCCCCCCCHFEL